MAGVDSLILFDKHEPEYDESLTAADKCVKGQPLQRTWHHYTSSDEKLFAGIWAVEPGCWRVKYSEHEYCHILSGTSILRDENGSEQVVSTGDHFVIPAGFKGEWEAVEPTRKVYVIYQP